MTNSLYIFNGEAKKMFLLLMNGQPISYPSFKLCVCVHPCVPVCVYVCMWSYLKFRGHLVFCHVRCYMLRHASIASGLRLQWNLSIYVYHSPISPRGHPVLPDLLVLVIFHLRSLNLTILEVLYINKLQYSLLVWCQHNFLHKEWLYIP